MNRGEHVRTNVVLYVDDERVNLNFVEKLQGGVIVRVPRPTKEINVLENEPERFRKLITLHIFHQNVQNYYYNYSNLSIKVFLRS